ncbi:hypothetical protein [Mycolicibacterium arseniciresistens]|uniref:Uncharacterized protein n=1 Tax=Mycolicibacterium arseniciresistens TaxID=3062257 RepID=A0ABT8UGR9_9MYCO|nr:hypothetical protein [Mycolicibacterium arseniciresistens]MDO3636000.1 hypothetical protein [Mycolicibacterium arseniciresistens]
MAEDEVDPDVIDDLNKRADEDDAELPEDVEVPLNVSDDEAVKAVKQQFKDAGTECTDDEALELVKAARKKAEKKKNEKEKESDDKSGDDSKDGSDDKSDDDSKDDSDDKSDDDSKDGSDDKSDDESKDKSKDDSDK